MEPGDSEALGGRTAWRMVAVAFLVMGLTYSIWYSFAVFLVALSKDLGWGRGETALGFSIFTLTGAAFAPVIGSLLDRLGVSRVMAGGAVVTAIGLAACSQTRELWQFYLFFGVVVSLGSGACGWISCVAVIQSWFGRNFSTANGLAASGVGVGIFLLVPGIQLLTTGVGWRTTYLILAAGALGLVGPLCLLLRRRPAGAPPADDLAEPHRPVDTGWTLRRALRSPALWFLLAMAFLLNFSNQQPLVHQIAFLVDRGTDQVLAATVAGAIGLVSLFAKPAWGYSADRFGREISVTAGCVLVVAALGALWWLPGRAAPELIFVYALLIGAGYSISNPLPPAMTADLFPGRHFGAIFGLVVMGTFAGSAVGAWLAGYLFDQTGSYLMPFTIAAIGSGLAIVFAWLAAPRRARARAARRPGAIEASTEPVAR